MTIIIKVVTANSIVKTQDFHNVTVTMSIELIQRKSCVVIQLRPGAGDLVQQREQHTLLQNKRWRSCGAPPPPPPPIIFEGGNYRNKPGENKATLLNKLYIIGKEIFR